MILFRCLHVVNFLKWQGRLPIIGSGRCRRVWNTSFGILTPLHISWLKRSSALLHQWSTNAFRSSLLWWPLWFLHGWESNQWFVKLTSQKFWISSSIEPLKTWNFFPFSSRRWTLSASSVILGSKLLSVLPLYDTPEVVSYANTVAILQCTLCFIPHLTSYEANALKS